MIEHTQERSVADSTDGTRKSGQPVAFTVTTSNYRVILSERSRIQSNSCEYNCNKTINNFLLHKVNNCHGTDRPANFRQYYQLLCTRIINYTSLSNKLCLMRRLT